MPPLSVAHYSTTKMTLLSKFTLNKSETKSSHVQSKLGDDASHPYLNICQILKTLSFLEFDQSFHYQINK